MLTAERYGPVTPVSMETDAEKYRYPGETFEESIYRLALVTDSSAFPETLDMLLNQRALPAGRIRRAVGSPGKVTAFNCYVMKDIPDSLEGIMDVLRDGALTMKMGGGTGYNFGNIRPENAVIKSLSSRASGPVSYMHMYDKMCATVRSAGERRGAMMFVLPVWHPDIRKYIHVKTEQGVLTNANLSIFCSDDFMQAVIDKKNFDLTFEGKVYETVYAPDLWKEIMEATWDWAEPGVLFGDRINYWNNLWYCETITATNPCAEQPLPPDGACLLLSHNLPKYIYKVGNGKYLFDFALLASDVALSVRFLDNVIDNTIYPLPAQEQEAKNKRRMGIGITGLANAVEAMGYEYGSPGFLAQTEMILEVLRDSAYRASIELAKEKGPFFLFDPRYYLEGKFIQTLPEDIRQGIEVYGIRNSHLLSVAPTGTISLSADNVSSGIEPVFSHEYQRTIKTPEGDKVVIVQDYGVREFGVKGKTALELTTDEHLAVLTLVQKYIDSAVSKTINVGDGVTFDEFQNVYLKAFVGGAKGCTTFRASGKRLGILVAPADGQDEEGRSDYADGDEAEAFDAGTACTFDPTTGRKTCE